MFSQKIIIRNGTVGEAKRYTRGNVPYDITIKNFSSIDSCGKVEVGKNINVKDIKFTEIPSKKGYISNFQIFFNFSNEK